MPSLNKIRVRANSNAWGITGNYPTAPNLSAGDPVSTSRPSFPETFETDVTLPKINVGRAIKMTPKRLKTTPKEK
jgi:hypothetical protein